MRPLDQDSLIPVQSVLIIGGDYNGHGAARSLRASDIHVHIVHAMQLDPVRFSRFADSTSRYPSIATVNDVSRQLILNLVTQLTGVTLVLTSIDAWVEELATHGEEYENSGAVLPFTNAAAILCCLKKDTFADWCRKNDVRIPLTLRYRQGDATESLLRKVSQVSFPLVIKPVMKMFITSTRSHQIVETQQELASWIQQYNANDKKSPLVIQEYIQGPVGNLVSLQGYIRSDGVVTASQYRKLRQTHGPLGCCTAAAIEECDPDLLSLTHEILVEKLQMNGFFDIEFKLCDRRKTAYLVEVNPRLGMLNYSATLMGVNLPMIAIADISGSKEPPTREENHFSGDWVWTALVSDLSSMVREAITVGDKVKFRFREILSLPASFWSIYRNKKVVDPLWTRDDPASAAIMVIGVFIGAVITLKRLVIRTDRIATRQASSVTESGRDDSSLSP
jgi:predicted ATP-grasp superfamily ATP-dependent carboligase